MARTGAFPDLNVRTFDGQRVVIRSAPAFETRELDGMFQIEGYGLKFDVVADLGWFTESFRSGAFSETLDDVRYLIGHDYTRPAVARSQKTMTLAEDDTGLHYEMSLDMRSPDVMSLAVAVDRGDIDKASIGFYFPRSKDYEFTEGDEDEGTKDHYEIVRVRELIEISAVNWPAHESSDLQPARSLTSAAADTYIHNQRMKLELLTI